MKTQKTILLFLLVSVFGLETISANVAPRNVDEQLREKIVKLIDRPDLSALHGRQFQAEVEFIVTRHNKIVVLATYAMNPYLDEYIKEKLNYQVINLRGVQKMTPYRIEVNFKQP